MMPVIFRSWRTGRGAQVPVCIGSTGPQGLHHLVYEIVDNAIDEVLAGHCTKNSGGPAAGRHRPRQGDNGRGIPVGIQPKLGIPAVTVVFTVLHAGRKNSAAADTRFPAVCTRGWCIGSQCPVRVVEVEVCDGHYRYYQRFEYGKPVCDLQRLSQPPKQVLRWLSKPTPRFLPKPPGTTMTCCSSVCASRHSSTAGSTSPSATSAANSRSAEVLHYEGGIRSFVDYIHERKKNIWDVLHEDVIYYSGDGDIPPSRWRCNTMTATTPPCSPLPTTFTPQTAVPTRLVSRSPSQSL